MAAATVSLLFLTACGSTQHGRSHILEISDVSLSGQSTSARLDALAKTRATNLLGGLEPGGFLSVYAFGESLTSSCEPITADFATQRNSEEQDQLRDQLVTSMPAAFDDYVACVHNRTVGGSDRPGSPIFGAIVESMVRAEATAPVTEIVLVTDGCSFAEGVDTCTADLVDAGHAEKFVDTMPAALKPDLSGIPITVIGLGQGTGMSSEQVTALRAIFSAYGAATGASLHFG